MTQIYTNIFNHENIENNEIHENFFYKNREIPFLSFVVPTELLC